MPRSTSQTPTCPVKTMSQQTLSRFFKPKSSPGQESGSKAASGRSSSPLEVSPQDTFSSDDDTSNSTSASSVTEKSSHKAITDYKFGPLSSKSEPADPERHNNFVKKLKGATQLQQKRTIDDISDSQDEEQVEEAPKKSKKSKVVKLTPLEQQFVDLKKKHPDKLLAIQVGYKYKFFGEDARKAAAILNIMLLPGKMSVDPLNCPAEDKLYDKFAYCSIPDVRLHIHLKRLLNNGLKVAVVDQNETAAIKSNSSTKNKLFERKISRVYTSSTYIDDNVNHNGNYVLCIKETGSRISLVAVDVYLADIVYDEFDDSFTRNELETRFLHLDPNEFLLIGDISKATEKCIEIFKQNTRNATKNLRTEVKATKPFVEITNTLFESLGSEAYDIVTSLSTDSQYCFAELVVYLQEFGLSNVFQLKEKYTHFSKLYKNMILDSRSLVNLEIFQNATNGQEYGSLLWLLDHTNTHFGRRLLKKWIGRPLTDREEICKRVDAVECVIKHYRAIPIESSIKTLKSCPDLEISLSKIHYERSKRKDTYLFLKKVNEILDLYGGFKDELINFNSPYLCEIFQELKIYSNDDLLDFRDLIKMIYSPAAIDDKDNNDHVVKYFNSNFFDYHLIQKHLDDITEIENKLNSDLFEIRKITKRPGMNYITNNKEPYLVEVRNSQVGSLPKDWVKINGTKSVSRFRTSNGVELYKSIQYHTELLQRTCDECFTSFVKKVDHYYPFLNKIIILLSTLDALFSLSAASSLNEGYSKPTFIDKPHIELLNSRNPISENLNVSGNYISNSFQMTKENGRIALITGPNMGGKSSFIRQVALSVIMAQIGCYIPADKGSKLSIFESIHTRMGAQDDMIKGESTFQVELSECSSILRECNSRSLVLLDEVGRGTSTVDGYAIAHSILHYLVEEKNPFVLFITHFQSLKVFDRFKEVNNYHLGLQKSGEDIIFTYKLTDGCCDRSYGINCAKLAGLPKSVLESAHENSNKFEEKWKLKQAMSLESNFTKLNSARQFDKLWDLIDELD